MKKLTNILIVVLTIVVFWIAAASSPATAEAHGLQAWKCKYLMYQKAPNGERYAWRLRCEDFRTKHAKYHRHGRLWTCYEHGFNTRARNSCVIAKVFGAVGQAQAAVRVATCESTLNLYASNGQYKGLMQMGSSERARFGHGYTAVAQAQAALRYYRISGWGPWECARK